MHSNSNSIDKYKDDPVLIGPNLGKPQIISYFNKNQETEDYFQVELLFIVDSKFNEKEVLKKIKENISILPIIGFDDDTKRGIRKEMIWAEIEKVSKVPIWPLGDPDLISGFKYESPRIQPINEEIYGTKNTHFIASAKFLFTKAIREEIDRCDYVMFDLVQNFPNIDNNKINYHSIVISNQNWENFTMVHATDLHISKRNDEVASIVMRNYDVSVVKKVSKFLETLTNKEDEPIENHIINPNNHLRLLIKLMNQFKNEKKVDLLLFTGDLIDFCMKSDVGQKSKIFDINNTNWKVFMNIILNRDLELRPNILQKYILPGEELMVPFYSVTGNHDYRSYHYSFRWIPLGRVINLKPKDLLYYEDVVTASPLNALLLNRKTMMGYNQHINPCMNYHVKLGENLLISLDSGYDTVSKVKELLNADPPSTGFSRLQVEYLKSVLDFYKNDKGVKISAFHAPILNPMPFKIMNNKLKQKYNGFGLKSMEDFKESNLGAIIKGENRADGLLDFKYGTISKYWKEALEIFNDNKTLVINGHTHESIECRSESTNNRNYIAGSDFRRGKDDIEIPVAIYLDDYSEKENIDPNYINSHLPFYVQTAAIGPKPHDNGNKFISFRKIIIKNNKLESFKIDYVSNYFEKIL